MNNELYIDQTGRVVEMRYHHPVTDRPFRLSKHKCNFCVFGIGTGTNKVCNRNVLPVDVECIPNKRNHYFVEADTD